MVAAFHRSVVLNAAGMVNVLRFEKQDPNFFLGKGPVFYPFGNNNDFTGSDFDLSVPEFHGHGTLDDVEQLVLSIVGVPHEFSLNPGQLHILPVELGDDLGAPLVGETIKFLEDVDGFHSGQKRSVYAAVCEGILYKECTLYTLKYLILG